MTSVEKRRSGRKSGGHRKHSDGGYSDTSSGGSFLDETDREVSNLTDRAFRSLCIGDEAVYNDSDLSSSSPCAQRDRQLAFNQSGHCRDDRERENLKRASHESFTLRMQQYGQDLIHGGMYGAEIERDPQWEVYGERTQGRVSATFQHSFVETSQQQESLGQEQLSLLSNGATEMSSKQRRSRSRVSSLIRAFNSEGQRDGAVVDGKPREWNDETSWDKSALMSIQRELSEFSTSYQQNFNSGHLPSHGTITSQDPNFYSSNVAAVSHMNSASSFMSSSHTKHSMSAQVNCNSNFFIHSEFSPFKVWRDYNRFPFSQGGVSGFMNCSEFPKWYETPMYKELSLEAQPQGPYQFEERVNRHQRNNLAPVVPPTHQRSTSTSTMMQKAPAVEKRCESELTGHYPHRKRTQSLGTYKLQSKRPSTASPTSEMSRRVQDTISSVKALQQKIKMMTEQNIVTGMTTNQPEGLCSNDNSIIFKNNAESMAPNVTLGTTRKTPFNISHLLTPLVYAHQEAETSEVGQNAVSPQPVEHAPVRAESRGSTPDIKMSSYRSRASSLLFNLKDNRKRVKSTYSPTKFKGLETLEKNIQPSTQEPRDTVIDIPDFPDPDIQVFLVEDSTRTNAASDQYSNHYQSPGFPTSRVATDNTQNEEEAGSIKPNELTDSQYFYSESSKEFKLSGSNYLPINEDERSNTDNVTDKVNNDSLEKLKKSDPLKHTDISQKRDSDPPKPFPFERKHKSAERNEGSGKDSHFTPPRALSSKERAQTKQEILTSKIKAHAEKEISAIKEKGFAVRDGFISKNPAKQFSGSQSMIIRQRPPAQDISKTYESTMSSNYNLKHQMEPSGTQIDPIKYFSPPSSATIPVNYAAITSNLSDHEEPMKSNVNGPKTTKNTKDKSYNMSANEGLVENQKKEKQTGIKSPIKSKEQTPQNKEEKKGADQRQNSSLKEKDNLDETEHLNKKKEEPSRAITVVEAESSKPMTTEETESKHEAVQEDSTPSLNNVLGQTKTLVADDSLQITGIMVSVRERKHSMDNGRSNISTLEQMNHKDCNNSEGLEVSVGNTSSIEVSMLEPKIEVVRNTYSTKKEDQTKVGMNNHSKNMQETSTLETKLKNESETVTEKKTNLQQESSTIIARPQMVTQCQEPLAEKGVPFTVTVLAKNKVLAESQPLLFKQDIKTNEMKDQTKETAKENSAKSIGKEKVKSSTEQNNLQKGPTTHTNNNFKPKEANSAENNRNDSDDAETLIKHDIQPSGKGDTTTVRNPSKSRNRDGKSAPLMEQNMCDSTPPKPFIKISPSINLTENKNNHVSPTHQYEQTHMGENKQHSENVLIGSIAIRVLPSVTEKDNLKKVEKHSITTILQETQSSLGKKANTLSTEDRSKDLSPTSSEKQAQDSLEEKLAVQSVLSCVKKLSDSLKISNQKNSINIPSDNTQAEKGQPQRVNIRKSVDDLKKQPMVGDYFQVQGVSDTNNGTHCDNTSDAVSKERELSGLLPNEAAISDKSCNEGKHMLDQSEKKTVETSSARVQDNNMKRKSGETEDNLASKQNDGPTERQSNKNEKTEASQAIHMRKHQTVNQPSLSAKDRQRSRNTHPTIEDTDKGKPQVKPKPKERVSTIPEISALADYARLKVIVSEDEANPIQEFPPNKKEGFFPIIQTRHSRRPVFTADAQELPVKQKSVPKKAEVNSKVNKEPKPVVFPITEKEHQRTGMFKLGDKEGQDKMLIDDKANERILDRDSKQAQHLKEKSKSSTNYRQHQRSEEQVAETDNQRLCQEQQSILQSNNAPSLSTTSVNRPRSNSASQHLKPIAISNPPEHVVGEVYSVEEITATPRKDGRIENALANIGEDRTEKRRQEKLPTQHEEIGAQQHRAKQFEETQASRIEEETRAKDMRVKQMIEENRASLAQEERRAAQREEERRTREREAIAAKIKERRERQRAAERRAEEEKASQEKGMIKAKQIKEERRMKEIEENRRTKVEEERRVKLGKEEELLKENEEKSRVRQQEEKAFQEEQQRRAAQVAQQKQQKRAAQVPQEEQQKRAAQVAQEEQQKRAAQEEQQRRAALEQQQKKAAEEEQQRRAAQEEQQRRAALEEQQKRAAQEEQQRRAALEQQQKKAAQEEQQRRVAQEEKQRRASQEKQQKSAALEEQQRRAAQAAQAAQEEQQRRVALEEQQKRAAQEEQQWIAAQVEQQRRFAKEEKRRRAAQEEQQRREALEEQQKRAAQEEQQMRATLTEKQMRAKQIEKEEDARNLEEERFKQIKEQKKADQEIEEQRRDRQKREEWIKSQSEEDERKAVEKEKALIKQRGERKAKEEMTRLIEESQAAIKEEGKRVARDRLQTQREEEIRAQRREEVDKKLTDQREKERATQMEEQKRAKPKMDPIQYYAITSTESEKKPGERQLCSPSPSQQRPNPSGFGSAEDSGSYTRSYRPHAPASPALSLPRSNTSSPALGVKPSMFRVKDNTFRGSSLTKSVKPRLHKSFGEDFRVGSPLERGEEEQEIIRRSAGTPDTGLNRLAAIKESSTFPYLSQDYSAYLPQHRPYSRRSIALDEDDSLSVVSNMSEDVDSCATSATDLADLRGLYDYERPESACSYSSDVSRSLGKPPTVPPKSEKALRRAKRLTTRRIKKEISKMVPDSPVGVEKSLQEDANIPSSVEVCSNIRRAVASPHFSSPVSLAHAPAAGSGLASLHSKHLSSHSYASPHATGPISLAVASPHATAPVSIPVTPPNATGPASHTSALKTVAHVSSSPTLHHDKHPAPVTQYHVESSYPHSYPMTQRKVLQDLGSGQYFVVDVPVQVKTKTFFDPETGKYVQLNVRESGQSTARVPPQQLYTQPQLQPQMQVKVQQQSQVSPASKPFGLYQGNHGYPKDYQAPAINSAASHSLSAPVTVNHNQQTVRLSHSYGHTAPEMGQNSEGHCYSPEKTPYMDTVNDKDKTYNTVYNTNGPYESFPEFDTNSQLARSPVCENDNSAHSQSQPRDIISISELEDFMELSDW
ncbi:uncharacterized protein LOC134859176 [Eleginops maclovinus]